jgi:hypothetical protein
MSARTTEELLQELIEQGRGSGRGGSGGGLGRNGMEKSAQEIAAMTTAAKANAKEFATLRAGMRLTSKAQFDYKIAQEDTAASLREVNNVLAQHKRGLQALTPEQKKSLEAERRRLGAMGDTDAANQRFVAGVQSIAGVVRNIGSTMIAGQAAVAGAIQSGASGFGIALAQLTANANTQNAITQSVASAATSAGAALMTFGVAGRLAGGALVMYAQKMAVESDLKTQAQNARNQILLSGGDALLKTYQEATASGAVLSGGFGQMHQSLKESRLTMEDYTAIVKSSGVQLASTGMGVGEASMMIGRVGKVLKDTKMDRSMLALGYSYQEQGAIMAQVMSDMRRRDPTAVLNDKEVAQRTKQYAIDLATLTNITGKNAKQAAEESRKQTSQLAFQTFLSKLGAKAADTEKAMMSLSPAIRQNVMDVANFGGVVNAQGAIMEATTPALAAMRQALSAAVARGTTPAELEAIQKKYAVSINQSMLGNESLNRAMAVSGGKHEALGKTMAEVNDHSKTMMAAEEARKNAQDAADKSQTGQGEDPATKLMIDMVELGQDIRKKFQEHIIDNLVKMGPLLRGVLASIGAELPGVSSKGVLQRIWKELKDIAIELWKAAKEWGGVWGQAGLVIGGLVAGAVLLAGIWEKLSNTWQTMKSIFGGGKPGTTASGRLPGTGGVVPEGGTRTERYRRPSGTFGTRQVPNVPGGAMPDVGNSGDGLGRFGAGIKSILTGLGQGAGGLIQGILTGIARGIGAFGTTPKVLVGAGILAGSIVLIGGAVAAATWMMGKALPTFAAGLKAFDGINGDDLVKVGKGAAALGAGMAVFGAGSGLASAGSIISNISDGFIKFFGGKTTLDQFREMAELAPQLKSGAEGITLFTKSLGEMILLDISKIDALAGSMEKLQKASAGPGFFTSLGDGATGLLSRIPGVAKAINQGRTGNQGGPVGLGQTVYVNGMAIVGLDYATLNYLIQGLGGKVSAQTPTQTKSKPPDASPTGAVTLASFNAMAKNDPLLFALSELLAVERSKGTLRVDTITKTDMQIALLDRIAASTAKTAGLQDDHARFQTKYLNLLK